MHQMMMMAYGPAASGASALAWNPANNSAGITLSESNYLASRNSGSAWRSTAGTPARSAGKHFAAVQRVGDPEWSIVIGLAASRPGDGAFVGGGATDWGLQCGGGPGANLIHSGAVVGTAITTIADGDNVRIAVDFDAGEAWIGNQTVWHGGGDPAAGTTPSFTFTPNTSLLVAASLFSNTSGCRIVTGTPPSGFSQW